VKMHAYFAMPGDAGGTLQLAEVERPVPERGELLIRVVCAGVNNGDVAQRFGFKDPRLPDSGQRKIGMEVSGVVESVGDDCGQWAVGDRAMGRCWGGYAEYAVVRSRMAMPIPDEVGFAQAATIPIAYVVAHDAVVANGGLTSESSVFVNASSSGVGVAAIQIARAIGAKRILGSTSSKAKIPLLLELGLSAVIDTSAESITDRLMELTQGIGVDLVVDFIGGPTLDANLKAMSLDGRLISVGRLGGNEGPCDLDLLAMKRLRVIGVSNRLRSDDQQEDLVARFRTDLWEALASRALEPHVDRLFDWREALEAHEYLQASEHVGKVVLKVSE
jgi:NADPH2:quinone reductase